MKKLLLLGGSYQQIAAIEAAKSLGYFTVLCDYLPDNPGQHHADRFYLTSTTDRDAILKVATEEKIDGIIAYASDPAAPTVSYVAEKLGLPSNPLESVEILCNKDRLRKFMLENNFDVPASDSFGSIDDALKLPINSAKIVKPVDSSGSKGVTVIRNPEDYEKAVKYAFDFSRAKRIIVEDYVERAHPYVIGGDIFLNDGEVVMWGLMNCHRDSRVNTLVPVGKSYPCDIDGKHLRIAKQTLSRLMTLLGIKNGPVNVELVFDAEDKCYVLDIGPRAGGNMIPELLGMIFNVDIVKYSVLQAMGEKIPEINEEPTPYFATHNLHSSRTGTLKSIDFHPAIEKYIVKKCLYVAPGDNVEYFDYSSKALGIVFLKFESEDEMLDTLDNLGRYVTVNVKENEIGGYFGLEQLSGKSHDLYYDGPYWPNSARNALVLLANAREYEKIYIPKYLCESVSNVLRREHIDFEYYDIGENLRPRFEKTLKRGECVYIVNYFGTLSEDEIKAYKGKYGKIIVDNVQCFFETPADGVDTLYSCRKFFGVPDGAYISTDADIDDVPIKNTELSDVPYLTGRLRDGATSHYGEFKAHDKALADEEPMTASMITVNMLGRIDYESVREKREKNYSFLDGKLSSVNKLKLTMPKGPYCYPFYAENAASVRKELAKNKIYVPTLWQNVINSFPGTLEADLAEKILPLPCDQRLEEADMNKIIDTLLTLI